jgi:hypothetical protein
MVASNNNLAGLWKVFAPAPNFLAHQVKKWNNHLGAYLKGEVCAEWLSFWWSVRDLVLRHGINSSAAHAKTGPALADPVFKVKRITSS